ncbi:entericidin A/B family lipoprotein [Sulfuriferula sp.]|nr:entericidin A/B family lipoprotein [Sulfuriferula sp.]MDP2025644.1 entericidin A/B family lipoprotein [Sulfuriferula sp.]
MRKVILFILLLSVLSLSACNTMHGFGQDVEKIGDSIKRSAS